MVDLLVARRRRLVPSIRPPLRACTRPYTHITGRPVTQYSHWPHRGRQVKATRAPGAKSCTPARPLPPPRCPRGRALWAEGRGYRPPCSGARCGRRRPPRPARAVRRPGAARGPRPRPEGAARGAQDGGPHDGPPASGGRRLSRRPAGEPEGCRAGDGDLQGEQVPGVGRPGQFFLVSLTRAVVM